VFAYARTNSGSDPEFSALTRSDAPAGGLGVRLHAVALEFAGHPQIADHRAAPGKPRAAVAAHIGLRARHCPTHRVLCFLALRELAGSGLAVAGHPALRIVGVLLPDAAPEHVGLVARQELRVGDGGDGAELPLAGLEALRKCCSGREEEEGKKNTFDH